MTKRILDRRLDGIFSMLLQSAKTRDRTHARTSTYATRLLRRLPWCIVGDLNTTPDVVRNSAWCKGFQGEVITAIDGEATCSQGQGRCLDMVIASRTMQPWLSEVLTDTQVPWAPHIGLNFHVRTPPASRLLASGMIP